MMLLLAATLSPISIGILSSPAANAIREDLGCQRSMNLQTCQMCSQIEYGPIDPSSTSLRSEIQKINGNGNQIDLLTVVPSLPSINAIVLYNHLPPRWQLMLPHHINSVNKKSYGWHDVLGESESKPLRSGPSNSMDSSCVNQVDKWFPGGTLRKREDYQWHAMNLWSSRNNYIYIIIYIYISRIWTLGL